MERLTYKQAESKIWAAYFKDEIKPFDAHFCFCGTLCDNKPNWAKDTLGEEHNDYGSYLGHEYVRMERALFKGLDSHHGYIPRSHHRYEDSLFNGMCAALDVLKQIHLDRGEVIDEPIETFKKRELHANVPQMS